MYYVERATSAPNRCAALPQLGQDHPKGYLDLGELSGFDQRAYVSIEALHMAARKFPKVGLIPSEDYAALDSENQSLQADIEDLKQKLEEAERENEAIDVLARKGGQFVKRKSVGRPPQKEKV
jgi:hypothetical protein